MPGLAKGRKRIRDVANGMSYEDVEGIIVTLGVVGALMIGFSVGLSYMLLPADANTANFPAMICDSPQFREYALHIMDTWDIGTHAAETFNFSPEIGVNELLDIKAVLAKSHGKMDFDKCKSGDVQASIAFLIEDFPMQFFNAWMQKNPGEVPIMMAVQLQSHLSTILLFMSVGSSLVAYMSLTFSPAREDTTGKTMQAWLKFGKYALLWTFILLFAGLLCFFIANDEYIRRMMSHDSWYGKDLGLDITFGLVAVVAVFLSVAATCASCFLVPDEAENSSA